MTRYFRILLNEKLGGVNFYGLFAKYCTPYRYLIGDEVFEDVDLVFENPKWRGVIILKPQSVQEIFLPENSKMAEPDNRIIPYKNRKINPDHKIRVYRNLHSKTDEDKYSIMQNKLVVGHTNELYLRDCVFVVSVNGRERVLKENQKNVHAFIEGYIHEDLFIYKNKTQIVYDPYSAPSFTTEGKEITTANFVHISDRVWFFSC